MENKNGLETELSIDKDRRELLMWSVTPALMSLWVMLAYQHTILFLIFALVYSACYVSISVRICRTHKALRCDHVLEYSRWETRLDGELWGDPPIVIRHKCARCIYDVAYTPSGEFVNEFWLIKPDYQEIE